MSRRDEEEYDSEVDMDDVDVGGIPRKARIAMVETFGGGIFGAIIAAIVLGIGMSAVFAFISFVHSLDIPVISYLFSPEFREGREGYGIGLIFFGFILFACFLGVLFVIVGVAWLFEKITDLLR